MRTGHKNSPRLRATCFERLETREVFATTTLDQNGNLLIIGDDRHDDVQISYFQYQYGQNDGTAAEILVTVNSRLTHGEIQSEDTSQTSFDAFGVSKITFIGLGGDDRFINLLPRALPIPVEGRGGDGDDVIYGGAGDDVLLGGVGNDLLLGRVGVDSIRGGPGNDSLFGDEGIDTLIGDEDDDELFGGAGDDDLEGRSGQDVLHGDDGIDEMNGGPGNDKLIGGSGNDIISGDDGHDELYGDTGDDRITGDDGNDRIFGGSGRDTIKGYGDRDYIDGGAGNDDINGGAGSDYIFAGSGSDEVHGGDGDDVIYGGTGNDLLFGDQDEDVLYGETGSDSLYGQQGDDELRGGTGQDGMFGGTGRNNLIDDVGRDRFLVYANDDDRISKLTNSDAKITFENTKARSWTMGEIAQVDEGLRELHHLTNDTRVLRFKNGKPISFTRAKVSSDGKKFLAENEHNVTIRFFDSAFKSTTLPPGLSAIHEVGHNWDSESKNAAKWGELSGWTSKEPSKSRKAKYSLSGDKKWWYLKSAGFARSYGKDNPLEDFATAWESYFVHQIGYSAGSATVIDKLPKDKITHLRKFLANVS